MIVSQHIADEMLKQILAWPYAEHHAKAILNKSKERFYFRELESLSINGQNVVVSDDIVRMFEEEAGIPQPPRYLSRFSRAEKQMPRTLCEPMEEGIARLISHKYETSRDSIYGTELEMAIAVLPHGHQTVAEILFLRHTDEYGFAHVNTEKFTDLKNFFVIDQRPPIRKFQPTPVETYDEGISEDERLPF